MKEKIRSTRLRMCFWKMPPAVCFLTLFALCFGALSVRAADPSGRVALTAVRMQRAGGQVYVSFAVKIAPPCSACPSPLGDYPLSGQRLG